MSDVPPAISIKNVGKFFGRRTDEALQMLNNGANRTDIVKRLGVTPALIDVSVDCPKGKTTVILGLSGCGKSTLLRLMNRLINPTSGQVLIGGTDICRLQEPDLRTLRRERVSMVFQQFGLLPHRTVAENVAFGLEIIGAPVSERQAAAERWITSVGLDGFENAYPSALSGGMRQRVGLARALASGAEILLMDEPFSALDPLTRDEMQDLLIHLQTEMQKTIVFVTHDVTEAFRLGDQLILLEDGRLIQHGAPMSFLDKPASDYVRRFLQNLDVLRGLRVDQVMEIDNDLGPATLGAEATLGAALSKMSSTDQTVLIGEIGKAAKGRLTFERIQSVLKKPLNTN